MSFYLNRLNQALPQEKQLKFMLVDEFKFFRRQEIKDVLAFLKLLVNRHDSSSFKRILKKFAPGIGEKTIEEIESDAYKNAGIRLTDFLDEKLYESSADFFAELLQGLDQENIIVFDVESTGTDTDNDEIVQIAAIKLDTAGKVKEEFVHLLKPQKKVGSSYYVHGFSDEYLAQNGEDAKY